MAKRTESRIEGDKNYVPTPMAAVLPLLPHLAPGTRFIEPCAGDGALVRHLEAHGHHCALAFDLRPRGPGIRRRNACRFDLYRKDRGVEADCIVTNPPWQRDLMHPIILALYWQLPCWFIFEADWSQTDQARPFTPMLRRIVSVGRVRWFEGSDHKGYDNAAWHLFQRPDVPPPHFYGRDVAPFNGD